MKLLTIQNQKTTKGEAKGYLTGILYLDPRQKGICPKATPGCKQGCLFTAGRGAFTTVQNARAKKTHWYKEDRQSFMVQLSYDIIALEIKAKRKGLTPCIRLNGTSDIDWTTEYISVRLQTNLFEAFPHIQFYDYTKRLDILDNARTIPNYHVTLSRSERNEQDLQHVKPNENIAVVFDQLPAQYHGRSVISGDDNDLRFTDPPGVVVGLSPKGKAKKDRTGFMVQTLTQIERN
jgi:hypothetical protein